MLPLHELHDVSEIVAMHVQVLLCAGQGQAARRIRCEVAQVPAFNELSKGRDARMLLQCP